MGIGVLFLSVAALCYILGQLGFISWVPEYAKGLGMSLNDAGTLVSNFCRIIHGRHVGVQLYSSSFICNDILTVLAGLAAILMPVSNTGNTSTYGVVNSRSGVLLQRDLHPPSSPCVLQQTKVPSPKLVNFVLHLAEPSVLC